MKWLQPPERVRRFTPHQILQHAIAVVVWAILALTALLGAVGAGWARNAHYLASPAAAVFLGYHLLCLVGIGIRRDVPAETIAFLPWGKEWRAFRGDRNAGTASGKYSPAEKADYLGILAWSTLAALTGVAVRWPSVLGVPSLESFRWIKAAHGGCGAALAVHVLAVHVRDRWFLASPAFRMSILTGDVPLEEASKRPGWIAELTAAGILVPAPVEAVPEEQEESRAVRELLDRGNRLAREREYEGSCDAFREALRLMPGYSQARFNLAVALFRKGDPEGARRQLAIFIETDPFNPMAEKAREMLNREPGPAEGDL